MAATVTWEPRQEGNYSEEMIQGRGFRRAYAEIALDSSYPQDGESVTPRMNNVRHVNLHVDSPDAGWIFRYDRTNNKIKAYRHSLPLIVEEVVTVASNAGQLNHKPLYIVGLESTAGSTTGNFFVIPTGETPITTQCAVTFTSGVLTFLSTDAVTEAKVTYIPQHESGALSSATLVVDEVVVAAAAKTELANRAIAIQYVWDNTDNILCVPEPVGEAPTATHNCVVDITNGTPATDLDAHADDEANSLKVTYLKYASFPPDLAIGDADITLSSEVYDFGNNAAYKSLVVPGFGIHIVGEETATNVVAVLGGPGVTAAEDVAKWDPKINTLTTAQTGTMTTTAIPWLVLDMDQIGDSLVEAAIGEDLSAVTLFAEFIGYD